MIKHLWSIGGVVHILITATNLACAVAYLAFGPLWLAAFWAVATGCWVYATGAFLQYKVADERLRSTLRRLGR